MFTIIFFSLFLGTAPAPVEPIDPAEDMGVECVLVSADPEVWATSGDIPLPCGPSLDDLPVLDPIDPETGCTPAASSENCPGDDSVEQSAPTPVGVAEVATDVSEPQVQSIGFSQMIRYI